MTKMLDIMSKLGTDSATVSHVEWLLAQGEDSILKIFEAVKETSLADALKALSSEYVRKNSLRTTSILLNDYCNHNTVAISPTVGVHMHNIVVEKDPHKAYAYRFSYDADITVENTIVRQTNVEDEQVTSNYRSSEYTTETLAMALAEKTMAHVCQFTWEDTDNVLQVALDIERAMSEIRFLKETQNAWGQMLCSSDMYPVEQFICHLLKTPHEDFYHSLRDLIRFHRESVDSMHAIVSEGDFVSVWTAWETPYSKDRIYIESPEGKYKQIHRRHSRFNSIKIRDIQVRRNNVRP